MRSAEYVSLLPAKDAPDSETSTLVVHLQRATGLPKLLQLNRSMLSPYVTMWLLDKASGVQLGQRTTWQHRPDTRDPVWNTAMPLHVPNLTHLDLERALLRIEVWDHDALLPPSRIGQADVPLSELLAAAASDEADDSAPTEVSVKLVPSTLARPPSLLLTASAAPDAHETASLSSAAEISDETPMLNMLKRGIYTLAEANMPPSPNAAAVARASSSSFAAPSSNGPKEALIFVRLVRGHARRKRLYVIRHGESEWNKAQSGLDLPSMYAQVDHPLSAEGRRQAEALGKTIGASLADGAGDESAALRELHESTLVLSSPLTRALQTCVFVLGSALRERQQSVRLAPNTRERINPGSADSFGCACGADEIHARLEAKTADVFDGEGDAATAQARAVCDVMLDDLEVRSRWWSAGPENKDGVAQRLTAFLHQVQYAPVESVVLVGHSHWIRELLKANLNPCVAEKDAAFASQLTKQKLSNCGVAQFELDFDSSNGPPIVGVRLLAGTSLVP